jgi:protein-S-isoprenylcysteine O-methyltransferase Ste14
MPLIEEMTNSGNWLFRWRSYLPFLLFVVVLASLQYFEYPWGNDWKDYLWEAVCLFVSLAGLLIRGATIGYSPKGTSGRNTKRQVAKTLNTKGMYSLVRHPLYLGNFLIGLGVFLFLMLWWVPLIYALLFSVYYERIMFAEEMFLREKFGQIYMDWASRTPAFLPRRWSWEKPDLPFSFRHVLKGEYPTAFGIITAMFCLEILTDFYLNRAFVFDLIWVGIFLGALVFYLVMRYLHKKTKLLNVAGR